MKCVGCINYNLQHITCEKPRESPIATLTVNPSIQVGVASIWSLATVERAETQYICMNSICYEYEVGGMPQSYHSAWSKWETNAISYCYCDFEPKHISSGWGGVSSLDHSPHIKYVNHILYGYCRCCMYELEEWPNKKRIELNNYRDELL